jgi:hypothetical protein
LCVIDLGPATVIGDGTVPLSESVNTEILKDTHTLRTEVTSE